jgi:hypothetical protein
MSNIEDRLHALGLELPAPLELPPGAKLPFGISVDIDGEVEISLR